MLASEFQKTRAFGIHHFDGYIDVPCASQLHDLELFYVLSQESTS